MPQGDSSRRWVAAALAEPCLWVEPLEIDFGRVHKGGPACSKIITVQNLGEHEVDVALAVEGQSCLRISPSRKDALRPGDLAVFEVQLDPSDLTPGDATTKWEGVITLAATLTEGSHKPEPRLYKLKAACRLVKLPKLVIRDEAGHNIAEEPVELTVVPSLKPLTLVWKVSRNDEAPFAIDSSCISYRLLRAQAEREPADFTSCLEVDVKQIGAHPTVNQVTVKIHTHNLPEQELDATIGFWTGASDPPVEPCQISLRILVKPRRVLIQWPEGAQEALEGRSPLIIPGAIGSWLPVKIVNASEHHLRVEIEPRTNLLSFEPSRVELAPGGETEVRGEFCPGQSETQDTSLAAYVVNVHSRETDDEGHDGQRWGESVILQTVPTGWVSCEVDTRRARAKQSRWQLTIRLENRTAANITLRPNNFALQGKQQQEIVLAGTCDKNHSSCVWEGTALVDLPASGQGLELGATDVVTGRDVTLWAGEAFLLAPSFERRQAQRTAPSEGFPLLGCLVWLLLAGFVGFLAYRYTRPAGSHYVPPPQDTSVAMLQDAYHYVERAIQARTVSQQQELLHKALALLDGVLYMQPDSERAHYERARVLSRCITYRPHPYEAELRRELAWLATRARDKNIRAEAIARAREWGFR